MTHFDVLLVAQELNDELVELRVALEFEEVDDEMVFFRR